MKMNNAYRRTQELEKLTSTLDTIYLNNFNNGGSTNKFWENKYNLYYIACKKQIRPVILDE